MDLLTFVILVIILCVVLFLVYYFFWGARGNISLARPVESRVDEYLDRRFQSMVEEWELRFPPETCELLKSSGHLRSNRTKHVFWT